MDGDFLFVVLLFSIVLVTESALAGAASSLKAVLGSAII
jgi:hypothetical protein